MNTIHRDDFLSMVRLQKLEVLTQSQMELNTGILKGFLEKANTDELNEVEKADANLLAAEIAGYDCWQVLRDDFTKAVVYTRREQIAWDEPERGEFGEILKARGGVYKLTGENKKLGRVGQKYGEKKEKEVSGTGNNKEEKINSILETAIESFSGDYENVYELRDGLQEQFEEELKDAGYSFSDLSPAQHKVIKDHIKEEVEIFKESRRIK